MRSSKSASSVVLASSWKKDTTNALGNGVTVAQQTLDLLV